MRWKVTLAVATAAVTVLTGCSGGGAEPTEAARAGDLTGQGEGALNLLTLAGDVENGSSAPRVDWVTPFEERTGCRVSWRVARSTQDMTAMMSNPDRRYDGVAAPPEVSGRLIAGRHAAPVRTSAVEGYKRLDPKLRTVLRQEDETYGVPYLWDASLLLYDVNAVPQPNGWEALFEPGQARRHAGRVVVRDTPLSIAEVALYLKRAQPGLRIDDPYSLTPKQLAAVRKVLERQRPSVQTYWAAQAEAVAAFAGGEARLGAGTPYQADVLSRAGRGVRAAVPAEGVTGRLTSWMVGARAVNPNCMYKWLGWTASAEVQRQAAVWNGTAPANPAACSDDRATAALCAAYRVGDRTALDGVTFARTPAKLCPAGKNRGERTCTDYVEWSRIWIETTKLDR